MVTVRVSLLACLLACLLFAPAAFAAPPEANDDAIVYTLRPVLDAQPFYVQVDMEFSVPPQTRSVALQMPLWSPGDYHIQKHGLNVRDLQISPAADTQNTNKARPNAVAPQVPALAADGTTWRFRASGATRWHASYHLPQAKPGFFSENVQVGAHQVFLNGPATFLYLAGRKNAPAIVRLILPPDWKAECALPIAPPEEGAAVTFTAPDYDTLADSPLVCSDHLLTRDFEANGVPHRIVFFGDTGSLKTPDAYAPVLQKLVREESRIMGGLPYTKYEFLLDVKGGGGGLEHLNCARLSLWTQATPTQFAPFAAHELFHAWNVKRIRPAVLGPFDYAHPPRTHSLWFAEGVTEYYAHVATRRAGVHTEDEFLAHWQRAVDALQRNEARHRVTAEEASLRVWEAGNSEGFGGLSYYAKGELIGLCLDLKLRHVTNNRRSLNDVMRLLMQRHNFPKPGYGEGEVRDVVSEVAGEDLGAFYDLLARSTQELPFAECLGYAGLDAAGKPLPDATPEQLALRAAWGRAATDTEENE